MTNLESRFEGLKNLIMKKSTLDFPWSEVEERKGIKTLRFVLRIIVFSLFEIVMECSFEKVR